LTRNLESLKRVVSDRVGFYAKLIIVTVKVALGRNEYANITDKFSPWVQVKKTDFYFSVCKQSVPFGLHAVACLLLDERVQLRGEFL
jgi:hypothetical protein